MIRAAIYARFSSDRQNDRSVDDQIASCRELCAREGFTVVLTFCDREISGASTVNRPGFQDLMRAAEALRFDVIVTEDVDRISRDQGDWHTVRKRLDVLGIAIHTASGKVGKLDGALRALMGEMFLENLVVHTRRGLESVIRDGRHAGGRAYGYRAIAGKPGELEIDQAEADIRRLAEVAAEAAELDERELVATLRQLVQAVIVHAPPGTDELAIEIKASLSELTLPGPLLKRSNGGVTDGSGGGTRTPDPRIMIPVL